MEDFTEDSIVLVTGANGHVAQHVISQLLSRSEAVRPRLKAAVRNENSAAGLKSEFSTDIDSCSLVLEHIPDIVIPRAFDSAAQDCTHIVHTAPPLVAGGKDVE